MNKLYEIFGGDNGNYKISEEGNATPVAFVRRNHAGGGYTVSRADESKSVSMRHMPTAENGRDQASSIMALLDGAPKFSADISCYVEINGFTIYLEVSEATAGVPSVSYWTKDYPQDFVTHLTEEQAQ